MVLYSCAGPVYGNVPLIVTCFFVTPGVLVCDADATLTTTAVASRAQSTAPSFLRLTAISSPSGEFDCVHVDDFQGSLMEIDWRFKRGRVAEAARSDPRIHPAARA